MRGLFLLTAAALLLGAFALPIGYYTFLRLLVCFSSVLIVLRDHKGEVGMSQTVFGVIAIIFNPVLHIYLHNKAVWTIIDLVIAIIFISKAFSISSKTT